MQIFNQFLIVKELRRTLQGEFISFAFLGKSTNLHDMT